MQDYSVYISQITEIDKYKHHKYTCYCNNSITVFYLSKQKKKKKLYLLRTIYLYVKLNKWLPYGTRILNHYYAYGKMKKRQYNPMKGITKIRFTIHSHY